MNQANKVGRPRKKGKGMLFKFIKEVEKYLRAEKLKTGNSMVQIVEETIIYRARFKTWPPPEKES